MTRNEAYTLTMDLTDEWGPAFTLAAVSAQLQRRSKSTIDNARAAVWAERAQRVSALADEFND